MGQRYFVEVELHSADADAGEARINVGGAHLIIPLTALHSRSDIDQAINESIALLRRASDEAREVADRLRTAR